MTTHVSVRLFWHDSGWNGAICRDPGGNVWCEAHEQVRTNKPPEERAVPGQVPGTDGIYPGCEMSLQAFSRRPNVIRVHPPDWMAANRVKPVSVELPPLSAPMWPYEDMWEEDGSAKPNDERRDIVERFVDELEPGRSLVFFYVDERNPLFVDDGERSPARLLVGISRLDQIGDISEWREGAFGDNRMVWTIPFQHRFPRDGIRLPVQAILAAFPDPADRLPYLVPLQEHIRADFRFGSSRIGMDRALAVVERGVTALSRLKADRPIEQSVENELGWLNERLLELWGERGPFPGVASVLVALGARRGAELQRLIPELLDAGASPLELIVEALESSTPDELAEFDDDLFDAGDQWSYLDENEQELAGLLMRMDLTAAQVQGVLTEDMRRRHRLPVAAREILDNPYLLCERYVPDRDQEPIAFLTVDHALVPHEAMGTPERRYRRAPSDPQRLRALLTEVLVAAAADGHTFLAADAALRAAEHRSPPDRPCRVPLDRLSHDRVRPVVDETIEQFAIGERSYLALRSVRGLEATIEAAFDDLVSREVPEEDSVDWQEVTRRLSKRDPDLRVLLSEEQERALDRSLSNPLSVLTGAAGTGKSTLLAPLLEAIVHREGAVAVRALTPTGKAADRLKHLGVEAMTIHRALARAGWFDWDLGTFAERGEDLIRAQTLIIDEASMVDVELLATLLRAVDWQGVRRLVLVGDHHQLPPIGPGRPFFDLIAVMTAADTGEPPNSPYRGRLSELTTNYRVQEGSNAIAFASGFAREPVANEPVLWSSLARGEDLGDLRIRFWVDPDELQAMMLDQVHELIEAECARAGVDTDVAWRRFIATTGHDARLGGDVWQILSPTRDYAHGTRALNARVQDRYLGWAKAATNERYPVSVGDEQITQFDRVMQRKNSRLQGRRNGRDERIAVFNGQVGRVVGTHPSAFRGDGDGPPRALRVEFDEGDGELSLLYWRKGWPRADELLQLAYAITVHKSQGSQYRHVFLVVPQLAADVFGRELTYTGLTRGQETLTLFVERDLSPLLRLRRHSAAKTPARNSRLFGAVAGAEAGYRPRGLIHAISRGDRVRSKSEASIGELLYRYERDGRLSFLYEEPLEAPGSGGRDLRLPDFTVSAGGVTWYWEHCGMVDDPGYLQRWEEVRRPWYVRHGFEDRLIVTYDGPDGSLELDRIEDEVIRGRILRAR
jgi:hypothetical protein